MAEAKDDIDLNELDSIDALLEEAEQALDEAEPDVADDAPEPAVSEAPNEAEVVPEEDLAPEENLAPQPEPAPTPEPETAAQVEAVSETSEAPVEAGDPSEPPPPPQPVSQKAQMNDDDEPPLPAEMKQPGRKKNNSSELTDADMDKLKKLILAFGISLIVMVVIGWGLSVWAAIAASTAHLDEETMTMLEEIKTGVEHVAVKSEKQDKTLMAVERKIDALSFQLEQLNGDLGKLEELLAKGGGQSVMSAATPTVTAHPQTKDMPSHTSATKHAASAPDAPTKAVATLDPEVKKTLSSINSRLIRTQKKVEQVYNRLVKLQTQYRAMLAALKKVEKGLVVKKTDAVQKKASTPKQPYYQYRAPNGDYPFDPVHVDSYP